MQQDPADGTRFSLANAPLRRIMRVADIRCDTTLGRRLLELGLVEGTEVQVVRRAPLGDPLQVRVGDYELSIRSSEASLVEVASR